jgi:hypothetical protein
MAGSRPEARGAVQMLAWKSLRQQRRRLINTVMQLDCNFIFLLPREGEAQDHQKGKEP